MEDGGQGKSVTYWQVKKACLVIAHYNYTLCIRSCGLSRVGLWRCPKNPQGSALDPPRSFTPENPEQRVTLSLQTPLSGICP